MSSSPPAAHRPAAVPAFPLLEVVAEATAVARDDADEEEEKEGGGGGEKEEEKEDGDGDGAEMLQRMETLASICDRDVVRLLHKTYFYNMLLSCFRGDAAAIARYLCEGGFSGVERALGYFVHAKRDADLTTELLSCLWAQDGATAFPPSSALRVCVVLAAHRRDSRSVAAVAAYLTGDAGAAVDADALDHLRTLWRQEEEAASASGASPSALADLRRAAEQTEAALLHTVPGELPLRAIHSLQPDPAFCADLLGLSPPRA